MQNFTNWEDVPENLKTKTQLSKEGLKLAPEQQPVAMKVGGYGPFPLYDKGEAIPKRQSQAQREASLANLQKARDALKCVDCGVRDRLDRNGRCDICRHRHWVNRESLAAQERLSELAAAGNWLIVDTETTGLDDTAQVVQIGIVDATGQVLMRQMVRPDVPISPGAVAVHGLDTVALAGAPTWLEVYNDVSRLLNGRHLLAYNAAFDRRILDQTCWHYGTTVLNAASWTCVMELFAAYVGEWSGYHGGFRWHKLTHALGIMGVDLSDGEYGVHDAGGDAWLTWKLVRSFIEP